MTRYAKNMRPDPVAQQMMRDYIAGYNARNSDTGSELFYDEVRHEGRFRTLSAHERLERRRKAQNAAD
jgi:hypothetical protein